MSEAMPIGLPQVRDGAAPDRAVVLYDGKCPLCQRGVAILRRLDWLERLSYANARDRDHLPACDPPLDPDQLLEEMHLVTPGCREVYHGFRAFRWMAWRLPLCWPVAPLLYIPGVPALGNRLYLWVARNRFHLVPCHNGICTLPNHRDESKTE